MTITTDKYLNTFERLSIRHMDHTPSWARYGDGEAVARFMASSVDAEKPASGWLEVQITETSLATNYGQKRDFTKEASITLRLDEVLALRDHLNKAFPPIIVEWGYHTEETDDGEK